MVGDGDKLSYLLPQTTVRRDIRAQPDELTHVMQDGVRSLVYNADRKHSVDEFLYTPAIKPDLEECVGLADGESYLRGFEVPSQPIKFLGMVLYPISAEQFTHLPEGTALSQEGSAKRRFGSKAPRTPLTPTSK